MNVGPLLVTRYSGGIGDLFMEYLATNHDAGYWPYVRRYHPDVRIAAILAIHNPCAADFLGYHPLVARVLDLGYDPPVHGRWREPLDLADEAGRPAWDFEALFRRDACYWERPRIHLDPDEQAIADGIAARGPHVAVHPFAGEASRCWAGNVDTAAVLDWILEHRAGRGTVVVLGGSSKRVHGGKAAELRERLDRTDAPGFRNLVGVGSIRLHAHLAATCERFVGTSSCYLTAAQTVGRPCLCITHQNMDHYYRFSNDLYCRMARQNGTLLVGYDHFQKWGRDLRCALVRFLDGERSWDDTNKLRGLP